MGNLLRFLLRYQVLFLFLLFETFSFVLLVNNSLFQRAKVVSYTSDMTNVLNGHITSFMQYLHLKEVNTSLADENAKLKNQLDWYLSKDTLVKATRLDTTRGLRYSYIMGEVVNNSTSKQHNYITLNRGAAHGVRSEMGVMSSNGIVGVVLSTSKNYAVVVSMLNLNFRVSARLKRTGYFGSLSWDGKDARYMNLSDIPQQAKIKNGDTVETSGYSTIFPEGVFIGVVESYKVQGGNFYQLKVNLKNDFKNLRYVHIISDFRKKEKQTLESAVSNEE
jgi:rod shape-determining protein MreC